MRCFRFFDKPMEFCLLVAKLGRISFSNHVFWIAHNNAVRLIPKTIQFKILIFLSLLGGRCLI